MFIQVEYGGEIERHLWGTSLMLGAIPNTSWLSQCMETDEKGFIRVGHDVSDTSAFPVDGRPMELESSVPGVFAVGDVRSGSVKRVASPVGEGSIVVAAVHRALELQRKARSTA